MSVNVSLGMKCKQKMKLYSARHLSPEGVRTFSREQDDPDHGSVPVSSYHRESRY